MMIVKMIASPRSAASVLSRSSTPSIPSLLSKSQSLAFASDSSTQLRSSNLRWGLHTARPPLSPLISKSKNGHVTCSSSSSPASTLTTAASTIAVGEKLPDATLSYLDKEGNVQTVTIADLTKGKKAILFAVPGAFTPTCSQQHLPGFVQKADELRAKGVETIACIAVNDAFVLRAWGESAGVGDKVLLLSDGNATFTKALGVTLDLSDKPVGLGLRSRRYSLLADDGVVKVLYLEEGGSFTNSGAEEILKAL